MISEKLKESLGDWECLYGFFESDEWAKIKKAIKPDFAQTTPEIESWFKAFRLCPYKDLRVVWLGLSPYYTKDPYTNQNVADGLGFSTDTKHSVPLGLFKIYKGMEDDLWRGINLNMDRTNDLSYLAEQGVLLINSALTTTYGKADSQLSIWEPFIQYVLKTISTEKEGIIFCGFGKHAIKLISSTTQQEKHIIHEREHPANSAHEYRTWRHENLFSKINEELGKQDKGVILWDKYLTRIETPF